MLLNQTTISFIINTNFTLILGLQLMFIIHLQSRIAICLTLLPHVLITLMMWHRNRQRKSGLKNQLESSVIIFFIRVSHYHCETNGGEQHEIITDLVTEKAMNSNREKSVCRFSLNSPLQGSSWNSIETCDWKWRWHFFTRLPSEQVNEFFIYFIHFYCLPTRAVTLTQTSWFADVQFVD